MPIPRRSVLYGGAAVAAGMIFPPALSRAALGAGTRDAALLAERLGIPMREVNIRGATLGPWVDGSVAAYVYSNGATGVFSVLDAETGERLAGHVIADNNSFDLLVSADGTVYISTHGGSGLFRYIPERDEVHSLGRPAGEYVVLETVSDENGVVYGGTYPNAHAFRYDPRTDEFFDYGPIAESESYLRNLAYDGDGDGTLYASTRPNGRLFAINVATGATREIALPESAADATNLRPVFVTPSRLLFVRVSPGWDWYLYDPQTGAWVDRIGDASQSGMTGALRTKTYYVNSDENLAEYDLLTRSASPTSWGGGQLHYTRTQGLGIGTLAGPGNGDYPGKSVIGVGRTGQLWHFNPQTGAHRFVPGDPLGSPVGLHEIFLGPDDNIYAGGYLTTGIMTRYLTATGEFEVLNGPQQVSGFANFQGKLYISGYPHHEVREYDPSAPWSYGSNPRVVFGLGEGQDRARPLEPAGARLAVGTQADSRQGYLDGQLMFYDPATGVVDRKGAPAAGHGVASLASNGSILVGGTTVNHLAAPDQDPSAVLFIWDLAADQLVWKEPVVPEAQVICGLVFADDGHLWGLTSVGTVFEFDTETRQVLRSAKVTDSASGAASFFFGSDGMLYGSTAGTFADTVVFSVDPGTLQGKIIAQGSFAALGDGGQIYYADGAELVRFTP